jgi:hypothetical protein
MKTPYSLAIHPSEPLFPTMDRLKNYNKNEVKNICQENSTATVTYNLTDRDDTNEHNEWFDSLADELQLSSHGHIQDKFSQSITDSAFDGMHEGKNPRTRDILKQMIEGACSDCNLIGEQGANEIIRHLTELHAFCNEKKRVLSQNTTSDNASIISMT